MFLKLTVLPFPQSTSLTLSLLPPFLWADVHHYTHSSETDDILQKHAFIPSLTYDTVLMAASTWHLRCRTVLIPLSHPSFTRNNVDFRKQTVKWQHFDWHQCSILHSGFFLRVLFLIKDGRVATSVQSPGYAVLQTTDTSSVDICTNSWHYYSWNDGKRATVVQLWRDFWPLLCGPKPSIIHGLADRLQPFFWCQNGVFFFYFSGDISSSFVETKQVNNDVIQP